MQEECQQAVSEVVSIFRGMADDDPRLLMAVLLLAGGTSYSKVGRRLGVTKWAVMKWLKGYKSTHPEMVESLLSAVTVRAMNDGLIGKNWRN